MKAAILIRTESGETSKQLKYAEQFITERRWRVANVYTNVKKLLLDSNRFDALVTSHPSYLEDDKRTLGKLKQHGISVFYHSVNK